MRNGSFRNTEGRWHIIRRLINQYFNSETEKKALCLMNHQPCLLNTPRRATNLLLVSPVSKRHSKWIFIKAIEQCCSKSRLTVYGLHRQLFYTAASQLKWNFIREWFEMLFIAILQAVTHVHGTDDFSHEVSQLISIELYGGHPFFQKPWIQKDSSHSFCYKEC